MSTVEVVPRSAAGTKPPVTIEVTRVPPSHAVHFRPFSLLRKKRFQETGLHRFRVWLQQLIEEKNSGGGRGKGGYG